MSAQAERLARLETTLVGAASAQVGRRRRRRRRSAVLAIVIAPLVLVATGSVARTGTLHGIDNDLSTLRDDRLAAPTGAAGMLASALGTRSRAREDERRWWMGNRSVTGYMSPSGGFCYAFAELSGGCLQTATLTPSRPLIPTVDRLEHGVRVYGLAADGVTAITVRARGLTRRAAIRHNTFSLQIDSPRITGRFTLTLLRNSAAGGTGRCTSPSRTSTGPPRETFQHCPAH